MGCPQRRDLPVRGGRWGGAPASGACGRVAAGSARLHGAPEGAPRGARASARRWVRASRRRPRAPLPGRPRASLHVFEFRQEALAEMMSADVENGMVPSDATSEFLRRVYELPAGERLLSCIQCGMGSGSCPLVDGRVLEEGDSAEVLWWVGCFPSYNKRNQRDTIALARILSALGVDFGIMGSDERCSGDIPCT